MIWFISEVVHPYVLENEAHESYLLIPNNISYSRCHFMKFKLWLI